MSRLKNALLIDPRDNDIALRMDISPKKFKRVLKDSIAMAKLCSHKHSWRYFINFVINNYEGSSNGNQVHWVSKPLTHRKEISLCPR